MATAPVYADPPAYSEPLARSRKTTEYSHLHAIEVALNSLVDDVDPIFRPEELLGGLDSAYDVTRASELALELWWGSCYAEDDAEPLERLEAERQAHERASELLSRLAENPERLHDLADHHAEVARREARRLYAPR
jgi:hypothetical protein